MRAAVAAATLCACGGPAVGEVQARPLDVETYTASVHAVLEPSCATLDCHGDAGRPLRLYAETGLRARDELRVQEVPLTEEEARANVEALAAIDPEVPPGRSRVLLAPLAERAGGIHHVGGDVWPSREDDAYVCVGAWLAGALDEASRSACERAAAAVALPPPD